MRVMFVLRSVSDEGDGHAEAKVVLWAKVGIMRLGGLNRGPHGYRATGLQGYMASGLHG